MAQAVNADRRLNLCALAGGQHFVLLIAARPLPSVRPRQHQLGTCAAGSDLAEEVDALVGQHDMPRFARLGLPDRQRADVWIEVSDLEPSQFLIARAGL